MGEPTLTYSTLLARCSLKPLKGLKNIEQSATSRHLGLITFL